MANGYRYGDAKPRKVLMGGSVAIVRGDLLYQSVTFAAGKSYPASHFFPNEATWNATVATDQDTFNDKFAGVALDSKPAAETTDRNTAIATGGVHEFDCAALNAAMPAGTLIGPDKASGNALESQKVTPYNNGSGAAGSVACTEAQAIGRLAEAAVLGATKLLVQIVSTVFEGGPQAKI